MQKLKKSNFSEIICKKLWKMSFYLIKADIICKKWVNNEYYLQNLAIIKF